ncbi:hypothetical protein F5Y17DRAFT_408236 [Xylariaceae sp. FL0594]|nr:hypothetical protein F5Y17DRAFT_408236 [Xylariaceae sp. FL0594]
MQFTTILAFALGLGSGVLAHPSPSPQGTLSPPIGNDVTVGQAGDTCGRDLQLSCCNSVKQIDGTSNAASGLLGGLLGGLLQNGEVGLFNGCSKLTVTALIGVDDLLNKHCSQNVACCQRTTQNQEGLVNVGLPCIALSSLI